MSHVGIVSGRGIATKVQIDAPAIAFAFFVIVIVFVGALRGETKETSRKQPSATIGSPMIPARCLDGDAAKGPNRPHGVGADVDAFDAEGQEQEADMPARFAGDFNETDAP